jgi:NDP-sugar pyrophosphorylase family protein
MFTGIQILEPRIFDYIPRGVFSHSTVDVYPQAIAKGEHIAAHVGSGRWYELSTLQRYLEITLRLLADRRSDTFAGARSTIGAGAQVHDSILWDDVQVEPGASVKRSILADGVRIASGERIENAVVVRAALVQGVKPPAKALKGQVKGENFVVSLTQ